jgi:hypothetical protein
MDRGKPILSLLALREAFEKSDKVTLSKVEFTAIMELIEPAMATGTEVSTLERELLRVRKIATPAWKACQRVSLQMATSRGPVDERKVREWKFILDDARVVYWSDLPQRLRHRWREFTGL